MKNTYTFFSVAAIDHTRAKLCICKLFVSLPSIFTTSLNHFPLKTNGAYFRDFSSASKLIFGTHEESVKYCRNMNLLPEVAYSESCNSAAIYQIIARAEFEIM